jgi:dipeptidyl aminopeptidase/acylaminoacyl peptidase
MSHAIEMAERIDRLRFPTDLSVHKDGRFLVAAVHDAARAPGKSVESRLWRFPLDAEATLLTSGPGHDGLPRCSPTDDRIAFASDRSMSGKMSPFILNGREERPIGDIPGTVEDLRWSDDGRYLIVHAADRGLDGGATNAATRLWWDEPDDPAVTNSVPRRRLFRVDTADGTTREIGPPDLSIYARLFFPLTRFNINQHGTLVETAAGFHSHVHDHTGGCRFDLCLQFHALDEH